MRKSDFCLCENKGTDQLRNNCEADRCLCFRYTDSTISLLLKSEISSFQSASVTVQVDLCQTWLETPKTGFLASRLKFNLIDYLQPCRGSTAPLGNEACRNTEYCRAIDARHGDYRETSFVRMPLGVRTNVAHFHFTQNSDQHCRAELFPNRFEDCLRPPYVRNSCVAKWIHYRFAKFSQRRMQQLRDNFAEGSEIYFCIKVSKFKT